MELLEKTPALGRSIRERFPYIDPLNHVQLELLHVAGRDADIAFDQNHLHVGKQRLKERPLSCYLLKKANALFRMCFFPRLYSCTETVPRRQHQTTLRPRKDPRYGA